MIYSSNVRDFVRCVGYLQTVCVIDAVDKRKFQYTEDMYIVKVRKNENVPEKQAVERSFMVKQALILIQTIS